MPDNADDKYSKNFIFASIFTGVYDVNRNEVLENDDFSIIQKWYESIIKLQLSAIVFHNTFSKTIIEQYTNENVQFVEVEYDGKLNPNVFRYFVYQDYLRQHLERISNIFVTDITDVEVIQDPFSSKLFIENSSCIFCGDEPEILDNEWMRSHNNHLRNSIPTFSDFEKLYQQQTLLNCGVIGGNREPMKLLLGKMVAMHEAYSFTNKTASTLDMGVFNYIARTSFADNIIHGAPVNTIFKKYETENSDCWFRHK
jgi:hypothetical protein